MRDIKFFMPYSLCMPVHVSYELCIAKSHLKSLMRNEFLFYSYRNTLTLCMF